MSSEPKAPFHLLMEENPKKPRLERRQQTDFLAYRYRAFHPDAPEPPDLWHGASSVEKALVFCCSAGELGIDQVDDDDDDTDVPGALLRSKIADFVGLLAQHCHSMTTRALALAILERTEEADALDQEDWDLQSKILGIDEEEPASKWRRMEEEDSDYSDSSEEGASAEEKAPQESKSEDEKDAKEETRTEEPQTHIDGSKVVPQMSPSVVRVQSKMKPPRLQHFYAAGGLPILSQWLAEATQPRTTNAGTKLASKTGALLLPLLEFLLKMPFDFEKIKESRINKKIKNLSKELGVLLLVPKPKSQISSPPQDSLIQDETVTHPLAGGLSVVKVMNAVDKIMKTWIEKATTAGPKKSSDVEAKLDPFAALKSILTSRLEDLNAHGLQGPPDEVPAWLAKALATNKTKQASKKTFKKRQTTEELARKERENERAQLHKQDLAKVQEERRQLLQKLRSLHEKEPAAANQRKPPPTRKSVQWKDGFGPASRMRNREALEDVRVFVRDSDVLAAAEAVEVAPGVDGGTDETESKVETDPLDIGTL